MNFENALDLAESVLESAQQSARTVLADLAHAKTKTAELLEIARAAGVTAVGISKTHPRLGNEHWGQRGGGAIFTPVDEEVNGWPAAWHVAEKAGVGFGCGNPGQHQARTKNLIDGVYEVRDGLWSRIDLVPNEDD